MREKHSPKEFQTVAFVQSRWMVVLPVIKVRILKSLQLTPKMIYTNSKNYKTSLTARRGRGTPSTDPSFANIIGIVWDELGDGLVSMFRICLVPISRVLVPVCAFPIIPIRPCISMELLMAWSSFIRTFIKISISSQGLASSIWMISNCELPSNARAISFKKTKATLWGFSHVFRFASSKIPRRTCLFHQENSLARLNPLERGHHFPCCPSGVLTTGEICKGQTSDMLLSTTRQSLFK